jgi:hypothetical protein
MRVHALTVLAMAVGLGAPLAAAPFASAADEASASGLKMAQDLVEEGRTLGKDGRWGDALERFRRAESLSHRTTPQLAFYVGYAEARVGELVAANVDLHRAIELARSAGNESVVKAAQAELPELEARTPAVVVTVGGRAQPQGLSVDGGALDVAALGTPIPLDPGDHTVTVTFASGAATRAVSLVERQRATLTLDAPEGAAVAPPSPVGPPSPPAAPPPTDVGAPATTTSSGSTRRTLGVVGMGAGGATLVASGVFYLLARSALSPVTSACRSGGSCAVPVGSPLPGDYDDARNKQSIALVLAGVGAAVGITGVVLFVTGGTGAAASGAATAATHLAPWATAGGGGASLGGAF